MSQNADLGWRADGIERARAARVAWSWSAIDALASKQDRGFVAQTSRSVGLALKPIGPTKRILGPDDRR